LRKEKKKQNTIGFALGKKTGSVLPSPGFEKEKKKEGTVRPDAGRDSKKRKGKGTEEGEDRPSNANKNAKTTKKKKERGRKTGGLFPKYHGGRHRKIEQQPARLKKRTPACRRPPEKRAKKGRSPDNRERKKKN